VGVALLQKVSKNNKKALARESDSDASADSKRAENNLSVIVGSEPDKIDHNTTLCTKSFPRLILHVGPHKTGSTAFQLFLENRTAELRQHGWLVYSPQGPLFTKYSGASNLACALRPPGEWPDQPDRDSGKKEFESFLAEHFDEKNATATAGDANDSFKGLVISSEEFDYPGLDWPFLATTLQKFGFRAATVLLKNRALIPDWWVSLYYEANKNSVKLQNLTSESFSEWRERMSAHDYEYRTSMTPQRVADRLRAPDGFLNMFLPKFLADNGKSLYAQNAENDCTEEELAKLEIVPHAKNMQEALCELLLLPELCNGAEVKANINPMSKLTIEALTPEDYAWMRESSTELSG